MLGCCRSTRMNPFRSSVTATGRTSASHPSSSRKTTIAKSVSFTSGIATVRTYRRRGCRRGCFSAARGGGILLREDGAFSPRLVRNAREERAYLLPDGHGQPYPLG